MLHLGSIRGTSIDVDFNFVFLVLFFVVMNYNPDKGIHYALLWIPVLFISVLVHELAHAAMIGIFGFGASQIVLTGMGGVTMNQRKARPWQDMLISLAGPVASFGIMFACWIVFLNVPFVRSDAMLKELIPKLYEANWFWALFNLIPVPPLDGGHATRDFFRMFLSERTAFVIAIWIAMVVGCGVIIYMISGKQYLIAVFIGLFVYMAFQRWQHFRSHGVPGD